VALATPASVHSRRTVTAGSRALMMSGAQGKTASQPIILILGDGGGDAAEQEGADHRAERRAAIGSRTVTCCRAETARTARPGTGDDGRPVSQPKSSRVNSMRRPKTIRITGKAGPFLRAPVPSSALTPSQDNKTRHAERRRFDAQRPVRAENGDDGRARDETEDLAGLAGEIADRGAEHQLTMAKISR
jgi:hypothetical protein